MQVLGKSIPELIGGTADLNNSVFAWLRKAPGQPPVVLGFTRSDGSPFAARDAAQVTILRVK